MRPLGVTRPIAFPKLSVTQRFPSEPAVMLSGLPIVPYSVMTPRGVIFPILFPTYSVNQTLPSGPAVMP